MGNDCSQVLLTSPNIQYPCFAILHRDFSNLTLVNLDGGISNSVQISPYSSYRIAAVKNDLYAVTDRETLEIDFEGKATTLAKRKHILCRMSQVVSFRDKIHIIQPEGKNMIQFNPANKATNDELAGCPLSVGFCCCASDKFIYSLGGGVGGSDSAMTYNLRRNRWMDIAPMTHKRYDPELAAMSNRIYVLGGQSDDGIPPEFYDEQDRVWCKISQMQRPRRWFSGCVVGDRLYVLGGDRNEQGDELSKPSIEVYEESNWEIVTTLPFLVKEYKLYACVWPHAPEPDTKQPISLKQRAENIGKGIKRRLRKVGSRKNKNIEKEGGSIGPDGSEIRIPECALMKSTNISFSTRPVADEDGGMIDAAPRLHIDSSVKFSNPVLVKTQTYSSSEAGEETSAPILHRDRSDEEFKEIGQVSIGEANEVNFEVRQSGEFKVGFGKLKKGLRGLVKPPNIHAEVDYHINRDGKTILVDFYKDGNTHKAANEEYHARNYVPFSALPRKIVAREGANITSKMTCQSPAENRILDKVYPSQSFTLDRKFIKEGAFTQYFEFDKELSDRRSRIKLMVECIVDGRTTGEIPLTITWPLGVEPGAKGECEILAQILRKGQEVLVLCYHADCYDISGKIAKLTENEFYELVTATPLPVCDDTVDSIELDCEVFPPNEDAKVIPSSHNVYTKKIQKGSPSSVRFIVKLTGNAVDADAEILFKDGDEIMYRHPFQCTGRQTGAGLQEPGSPTNFLSNSNVRNITFDKCNIVVAGNVQNLSPKYGCRYDVIHHSNPLPNAITDDEAVAHYKEQAASQSTHDVTRRDKEQQRSTEQSSPRYLDAKSSQLRSEMSTLRQDTQD